MKEMPRHVEVPMSYGELLDRITILEIKSERIRDDDKLKNINGELSLLHTILFLRSSDSLRAFSCARNSECDGPRAHDRQPQRAGRLGRRIRWNNLRKSLVGESNMTAESFIYSTGNQANVAASRTTHIDMWNGHSNMTVQLRGIYIIPTLAAVTGVGLTWEVVRTTTTGAGGTELTPGTEDPRADTTHIAPISARSKPESGAAGDVVLLSPNTSSEETTPYASEASTLNHIPAGMVIDVPPETGIRVDQTTSSNVGSTNIVFVFSVGG